MESFSFINNEFYYNIVSLTIIVWQEIESNMHIYFSFFYTTEWVNKKYTLLKDFFLKVFFMKYFQPNFFSVFSCIFDTTFMTLCFMHDCTGDKQLGEVQNDLRQKAHWKHMLKIVLTVII